MTHSPRAVNIMALMLMVLSAPALCGCKMHVEAVTRPAFSMKGRVGILGQLDRTQEELFTPLYMKAFPHQALVERRDLEQVIGEQDLAPERMKDETRANVRRILGVTAIVFPNYTEEKPGQLSIKVVDTESGEIVAAILVTRVEPWFGPKASDRMMIYKGVDALRREATRHLTTWPLTLFR